MKINMWQITKNKQNSEEPKVARKALKGVFLLMCVLFAAGCVENRPQTGQNQQGGASSEVEQQETKVVRSDLEILGLSSLQNLTSVASFEEYGEGKLRTLYHFDSKGNVDGFVDNDCGKLRTYRIKDGKLLSQNGGYHNMDYKFNYVEERHSMVRDGVQCDSVEAVLYRIDSNNKKEKVSQLKYDADGRIVRYTIEGVHGFSPIAVEYRADGYPYRLESGIRLVGTRIVENPYAREDGYVHTNERVVPLLKFLVMPDVGFTEFEIIEGSSDKPSKIKVGKREYQIGYNGSGELEKLWKACAKGEDVNRKQSSDSDDEFSSSRLSDENEDMQDE